MGSKVQVSLGGEAGGETIEGSHLLVATGRRPNVEGLGLEQAGIRFASSGIVVDKGLRTTNRRVYAIGDVTGGPQFTHAANHHAGLVVRNALFRLPVKVNADLIPTFSDPDLGRADRGRGAAARRPDHPHPGPIHENDRARAARETADQDRRRQARPHPGSDDGRGGVAASSSPPGRWRWGCASTSAAGMAVPYPALAEIGKRAAIGYFTRDWPRPWCGGFLRAFG
jgi:hypothetical protein